MTPAFNIGNRTKLALVVAIAGAGIAVSLFTRTPISNENWGYWLFSRIFAETGTFITPDRSPLYTLYLNGFRWLGYPNALTAEYLVSISIVTISFVSLFKRYLGLPLAVFTALLWVPFLQQAAPAVQPLAMACSFWAMALRRSDNPRWKFAGSYAFLILASMLRFSYIIFVLLFVLWDIFQVLRNRGFWTRLSELQSGLRARWQGILRDQAGSLRSTAWTALKFGWPVVIVLALMGWFWVAQSPSRWNNGNTETMTWYPVSNPKSMSNIAFIHGMNFKYVERKYGDFVGRDFYFTNQELFDGETGTLGAFRANPGYVVEHVVENFQETPRWIANFTVFRAAHQKLRLPWSTFFNILIIAAMAYGAVRLTMRSPLILFVIGNAAIVVSSVMILPEFTRHFVPLIPILVLSAYWYGIRARGILTSGSQFDNRLILLVGLAGIGVISAFLIWKGSSITSLGTLTTAAVVAGYALSLILIGLALLVESARFGPWAQMGRSLLAWSALPIALIVFSTALADWPDLGRDVASDVRRGEVQVLGNKTAGSLQDSSANLESIVEGCTGVLTMEQKFIGAFLDVPIDRLYDVFEIPPFGGLGDSEYDGLRPDRIDCVIVSDSLATSNGKNVNIKMRYDNFVAPYVEELQAAGATTRNVENFGKVVVLERSP